MRLFIFLSCGWTLFFCIGCKPKPSLQVVDKESPAVAATAPSADMAPAVNTPPPELVEHLKTGRKDDPLVAKGPFDSIKAMCPVLKKAESRLDIDDEGAEGRDPYVFEFTCQHEELKRVVTGLPPPLSEVVFFTSSALATNHPGRNHCNAGCMTEVFLNVAVRVEKKWHLFADVDRGLAFAEGIQILEAAVKPVGPAGAKVLVVRLHVDTSLSNMFASEHEGITVIGAGPSGQPAMIPIVQTLQRDGVYPYGDDPTVTGSESRREVRFEDGTLVVYRLTEIPETQSKRPKKKVTDLNERHKIAFQ